MHATFKSLVEEYELTQDQFEGIFKLTRATY